MTTEPVPTPVDNTPAVAPVVAPVAAPAVAPVAVADWKASLPEDVRSSPSLAKFTTLEGLAKSYGNLERMLGTDRVAVPKDGDTEGWETFYKTAGRPEKAEGYGFKAPETIPAGMQYDATLDTKIAEIIHKGGANKHQANVIRQGLLDLVASGVTQNLDAAKAAEGANAAAALQAESALKAEWGAAFDERGRVAGAAINKFLSQETITAMTAAGMANNPSLIKDMYNVGVKLAGEKQLIGESAELTPADLDSKIAKFNGDNMSALMDSSHPAHAALLKERNSLYERRYGTSNANMSVM